MPDSSHATSLPSSRNRRPRAPLPPDFDDPAAQAKLDGVNVLASLLDIGVSTVWRYVAAGRIDPPIKVGRASKWTRSYARQLAANGIA